METIKEKTHIYKEGKLIGVVDYITTTEIVINWSAGTLMYKESITDLSKTLLEAGYTFENPYLN